MPLGDPVPGASLMAFLTFLKIFITNPESLWGEQDPGGGQGEVHFLNRPFPPALSSFPRLPCALPSRPTRDPAPTPQSGFPHRLGLLTHTEHKVAVHRQHPHSPGQVPAALCVKGEGGQEDAGSGQRAGRRRCAWMSEDLQPLGPATAAPAPPRILLVCSHRQQGQGGQSGQDKGGALLLSLGGLSASPC